MRQQSNIVSLPAELVQQPGTLPAHCTRHGRPAARRVDFALQSKVRIEGSRVRQVGVFGGAGMADRLGQHAKKVRVTHVKGWPLCHTCARTRASWLVVSSVMFFGGLLAFVGSLIIGIIAEKGTVPWLAGVAVAGFVLLVLSAFPFHRGSLARLVGANTAPDGTSVRVTNPSAAFVAELPRTG
ncbi:hypothetical protein [Amycolatopsis cihanbeyliensis]|uniref:Uncharacterized protein n=1 Tax=Amycolatopsis cihanbeyliensis TaxID=1128664 RepID=A0A542DH73_AMYCI|nr:hypothetical protein [Amycolatopsis cihanbeyliensis]TQJ02443.1 hypothetical protein FB471_2172 [Amycolatopsis cihanbeyliensis]